MAAVLALGGPLAALATATTGGTAGGGPGVPATPAPATPAPAPSAPAGAGSGPAGPDGHLVPSPSAATMVMVLIIPAGLLLALARRQAALPAAPARRGPHRPG
jgi:DNA polymerase-3 subunit gamma/tau